MCISLCKYIISANGVFLPWYRIDILETNPESISVTLFNLYKFQECAHTYSIYMTLICAKLRLNYNVDDGIKQNKSTFPASKNKINGFNRFCCKRFEKHRRYLLFDLLVLRRWLLVIIMKRGFRLPTIGTRSLMLDNK